MIISHSHRFIFIRTRKTASTSTELALASVCGPDDIITPFCRRDEALRSAFAARPPQHAFDAHGDERFDRHASATEVRAIVGDNVWADYLTFCVERNPWEKVVSLYFHRYKTAPRPPLDDFVFGGEMVDAYNHPLYTVDGQLAVDHVARYEQLEQDLRDLLGTIGIDDLPPLARAKSQFRVDHRPARDILSAGQRDRIGQVFAAEVNRFGYEP